MVLVLLLLTLKQIIQEVILFLAQLHQLVVVAPETIKARVVPAVQAAEVDGLARLAAREHLVKVLLEGLVHQVARTTAAVVAVALVLLEPTAQLLRVVMVETGQHLLTLALR